MPTLTKTTWAHLALIAVAFLYGANYSIAKVALAGNVVPPFGFIAIRVIGAGLIFTLVQKVVVNEKVAREDWGRFVLCAICGGGFNLMFFFKGLQITGAINASLITTLAPILVIIISAIFIGEKITARKVLGIFIGAGGAITLILYGKQAGITNAWGDFFIFMNALIFAFYLVLVKTLTVKYHPFTIIRWVFTLGSLIVIPVAWSDLTTMQWATYSPMIWGVIAYVVIGATVLTYLFNTIALSVVNPSVVSIYIYLQPLIATGIALSFGAETLPTVKIIAGLAIFIGVFLVSKK
ncbi:MAG: DMT family transporter [Saprospiraceae bacterium]